MTALPVQLGATLGHRPSAIVPSEGQKPNDEGRSSWLPLPRVAELLGLSEGQLRRRCLREYAPQSLARQQADHRGRNVWHIHLSADPRLLRAEVNLPLPLGEGRGEGHPQPSAARALLTFTAEQRELAMHRATALVRFRAWRLDPAVHTDRDYPAFAAGIERDLGLSVSRRQMYAWHDMAPGAGADLAAIALALVDRRGRPGGSRVHPSAWAHFEAMYLTPQRESVAECWRTTNALATSKGWPWPSLSRVKQLVREKIDAGRACYHREGQAAWERLFAAPLEQDPDAWAAGECWESDHSRFDLFIRVQSGGQWVARRPWITAWLDRRSRRLVGWHIDEVPSGDTIRFALLAALRSGEIGPPTIAWLDHGKDYEQAANVGLTKSEIRDIRNSGGLWWQQASGLGILGQLDIQARFAQPYNHNGKARVERFFGTMHQLFDRKFPSWCGSAPGDRDKDTLNEVLAQTMRLPTIEELREQFIAWADAYNHRADHAIDDLADPETGRRLSPVEFYERFIPSRRVLPDREALALLEHRWSRPLKVSKHGISLAIAGRVIRYGSTAVELDAFKGTDQTVFVTYDLADTSRIRVYDACMRIVCIAQENEQYGGIATDGVSVEARKRAMRIRRDQRRRAEHKQDVAATLMSDAELAVREQRQIEIDQTRARLAESGIASSPPMRLVRTALDGQSKAVREAERRVAVGAESMSGPPAASLMDLMSAEPAASFDGEPAGRSFAIVESVIGDDGDAGDDVDRPVPQAHPSVLRLTDLVAEEYGP